MNFDNINPTQNSLNKVYQKPNLLKIHLSTYQAYYVFKMSIL